MRPLDLSRTFTTLDGQAPGILILTLGYRLARGVVAASGLVFLLEKNRPPRRRISPHWIVIEDFSYLGIHVAKSGVSRKTYGAQIRNSSDLWISGPKICVILKLIFLVTLCIPHGAGVDVTHLWKLFVIFFSSWDFRLLISWYKSHWIYLGSREQEAGLSESCHGRSCMLGGSLSS